MRNSRRGGSFVGFLAALVLGGLIGAGICYYALRRPDAPEVPAAAPAAPHVEPESEAPREAEDAGGPAPWAAGEEYIARKLREWNLTPEELKGELAKAGEVVRRKTREFGERVADATADVTIIAKIKAKYTLDDELPALKITVGCKDGHVTLSGVVPSAELIGRAIVLALETEGVVDVVSSIKIEPPPQKV